MANTSNPTPNSVIVIATWAFAGCLAAVVVTLSIIVIRDGNTPLVSQAMGELLWLGGIAIAVLAGLLGFTKYLELAPGYSGNGASAVSADPGVPPNGVAPDPSGAVASLVAALLAQAQQSAAPAA